MSVCVVSFVISNDRVTSINRLSLSCTSILASIVDINMFAMVVEKGAPMAVPCIC